jgi:hypothetical protein
MRGGVAGAVVLFIAAGLLMALLIVGEVRVRRVCRQDPQRTYQDRYGKVRTATEVARNTHRAFVMPAALMVLGLVVLASHG